LWSDNSALVFFILLLPCTAEQYRNADLGDDHEVEKEERSEHGANEHEHYQLVHE